MRPIDGDALKGKLKKHHDLFVDAWGGFKNLPPDCKARVDEISSCIAEIVNAPTIEQYGTWIPVSSGKLPNTEKPYKAVLLQLKNSMVAGYTNKAGQWFVDTGDGYCEELNEKPIAWMPLPEQYREEKKDE